MTVLCPDIKSATQFNFRDLKFDQFSACCAMNQGGKDVYNFERETEMDDVNTIYDEMPLEGWWPWPKRPHGSEGDLLL